jgi:trigger factor
MEYKINKKPKSEIELTVSFTADEIKAVLPQGAQKISEHLEIKGFRKGKVPFEIVMREVGAMKVYEHAAEILVSKSYTEILTKENI